MAKKNKTNTTKLAEVYVTNVYEDGLEHNFDIVHDEKTEDTMLFYSNKDYWNDKLQGTCAGILDDDGDSVNISIDDVSFSLGYDQMERLTALVLACSDSIIEIRESRVVSSLNTNNK